MSYTNVPLNIAGPSYQARSVPISAQRTVNFYPEHNKDGLSEFSLMPWPGRKTWWADGATGKDRGMHIFNDLIYKVTGTTLYEVSVAAGHQVIGFIAGDNFCSFADNGSTMVICNGLVPYSYTGTTLSVLTDITFNPKAVTYLNKQFIFDGDDGLFSTSDPGTTDIDPLNNAEPESAPDPLVIPYAFNQILYVGGTRTWEPWDNTGSGNPPFERLDGAIIEDVGVLSPYGVTSTANFMYFISFDGIAHRVSGMAAQPISPPAVSRLFQSYSLSTYNAFAITFDAQRFVVFAFTEATWVFAESLGEWFELEDRGEPWPVTSYVKHYGKMLVGVGGEIQELDFDTFTDDGTYIARERILPVIAGETFGNPRRNLEMSKLFLSLEAGVGTTSGQGQDPVLIVQPSYDGGKTWGREDWIRCGTLGEFEHDVEWHNLAQFKQMAIRLRMTDPVNWAIYAASIDLREAGY